MDLHSGGSLFPEFPSSHSPELNPSASQNVLNASAYTLASEQQHPPYISSQRPIHDSISWYCVNDSYHDQVLSQAIATGYPESSQRTIMHNSPYLSDYDTTRDFQSSDIRNDQAAVYASIRDSDLDHIPSDPHLYPRMSEQDVQHYRQDPLATFSSHPYSEYGSSPATVGDKMSYPTPYELTYSNGVTSRAPVTASKRRSLSKAIGLQARHRLSCGPEDSLPPGNLNGDSVRHSNMAILPSLPSIPMSNNPAGSQASLHASDSKTHRSSCGFPCATSDPDSSLVGCSGSHEAFDDFSSSSSKKRRSKMHECEVCGKMFPRPSGLQTHMNTHNNVKPFPCGYLGCDRTFAVRSNAKRHLRTHGVVSVASIRDPPPGPYVIDFSAPTIMGSSAPTLHTIKAPLKLRWMPPSLTSRSNVQGSRSLSDRESDSDDPDESVTNPKWGSASPVPFCAVVPSLYADDESYEEGNSYLDGKSYL